MDKMNWSFLRKSILRQMKQEAQRRIFTLKNSVIPK